MKKDYIEGKIYKCPLCHAVGYVYPGIPPAINTYRNKCGYLKLNGRPNRGTSHTYKMPDSWRGTSRTGSTDRCEFPYTDLDGLPLQEIPLKEYIEFTRDNFDVSELAKKIIEYNQELGFNLDISLIKF